MNDKLISPSLKMKIEKAIDSHMSGSGFKLKLRKAYDDANKEPDTEMEGGAYGLYVKKKAAKRKGGSLVKKPVPVKAEPKIGRPKTKKTRSFDPSSKTSRRANKVKEIMRQKNLSMIHASSYIKKNNIPY